MMTAQVLTRRRRLWIAICLCACGLGIGGYWLYRWHTNPLGGMEEPQPLVNRPPEIRKVTLKVGRTMRLDAPECRGADRAHVLQDGQGQIWVLLAQTQAFQFSRWSGGKFSPLSAMPAVRDWGVDNSAVALTDENLPIVFWRTFGEPGTVRIVSSRWTPQGWSPPVTLDTMPTPGFIFSFDAIRDTAGTVHLVYDRRLDPPEVYWKSLIAIDSSDLFKPRKAFHVYLRNGSWSQAASTTGPGRFDISNFHFSLDPQGLLCLSGKVRQSDPETGYIARQFWRDGQWSKLKSLTPTSELESCWIYSDLRGVTHIWFNRDYAFWRYQQLTDGRLSEAPLPCDILRPVIRRLADGRIALLSQRKLTVWNGREWCQAIDVNAEDMSITPAGSILAWIWEKTVVRINEVRLEDGSSR